MWTKEQRNNFAEKYITVCKYFEKDMNVEIARMVVDALQELDFEKSMLALVQWVNVDGRSWPRIADLKKIINPQFDDSDIGKLTASKIYEAIGKFGYSNYSQAMNHIGPLGEAAVRKFGGWTLICEQVGDIIPPTTFIAQIRDLITSMKKEQIVLSSNENQISYEDKKQIGEGLQQGDFKSLIIKK